MYRLSNPIQSYSWGQPGGISRLLGRAPTTAPEAEMWMGSHPSAPSRLADGTGLDALIGSSPESLLGASNRRRFGDRLPLLFKVLSAGQPLSIQAHPSLDQARAGFARENAAGIALTAPNRNYRDDNHKPELICALTEFQALCGFKSAEQSAGEFDAMGLPWWASSLRQDGIAVTMTAMLELDRAGAAPDIREASKTSPLAKSLSALHGNDPGVLVALLLHAVTLQPGEALYLPAGNVHAYLHGTGVELMANSDNVLRGGLTTKNVDVAELMAVADVKPRPVDIIGPDANGAYPSPAPEFELVRAGHGQVRGPAIALCVSGAVGLHGDNDRDLLGHGDSVFIGHDENVEFRADGVAFMARVPD